MADKFLEQLTENTGVDGLWMYGVQHGQDVKVRGASIGGGGGGGTTPVAPRTIYAGPAGGTAALPTFRQLQATDIPDLSGLYLSSAGGVLNNVTLNSPTIVGGNISGATSIVDDNKLTIRNASDTTKQLGFDLSLISAGNRRTIRIADSDQTLVGDVSEQLLTNKRLVLQPSTISTVPLVIPPGTSPAAPANGSIWSTSAGLFYRNNGVTIGPIGGTTGVAVSSFNGRNGDVMLSNTDIFSALGYVPVSPTTPVVSSFNTRTGSVTLSSSDVISALGYTPAPSGGGGGTAGVITFNGRSGVVTLTSGDVTTGLGYTPLSNSGGTVSGTVTAAGLSVAGNAVWHAGNFTPADYAKQGTVVSFSGLSVGSNTVWHAGNFDTAGIARNGQSASFSSLTVGSSTVWHAGNFNATGVVRTGDSPTFAAITANSLALPGMFGYMEGANYNIRTGTSGTGFRYFTFSGTDGKLSTLSGGIHASGDITCTGAVVANGNVTAFSDRRLKTNVSTVENALEMVDKMRGVWYSKDNKAGVGVIAQEMEEVLPEVVQDNDSGYKSVAYGNIVGVLIEAIKELRAEVEALKAGA